MSSTSIYSCTITPTLHDLNPPIVSIKTTLKHSNNRPYAVSNLQSNDLQSCAGMSRLAMPVAAAEHSQPSPVSVSPSGRLADIPEASIEKASIENPMV